MTPEEIAAKMAELEQKTAAFEADRARLADLESRVAPRPADPDEAYKPKTWKDLDDKVDAKAEAAALKVLEQAREKEQKEKQKQERELAEQNEKIEKAFEKLEKEGLIAPTTSKTDEGGRQRAQILGSLVRSGGQHVEIEAQKLKTAWDAGLEYDYETNSFKRAGSAPAANRDAFVASSAGRTPQPAAKGPVSPAGARGDLDLMRRRWEQANGAL